MNARVLANSPDLRRLLIQALGLDAPTLAASPLPAPSPPPCSFSPNGALPLGRGATHGEGGRPCSEAHQMVPPEAVLVRGWAPFGQGEGRSPRAQRAAAKTRLVTDAVHFFS